MTATVHGRADWQARPARSTTPIDPGASVTIHWEGTSPGDYGPGSVPELLRTIQAFHMDTRGWNDIAYNLIVDRFGDLWAGRGPGVRSAANGTVEANKVSYAVCALIGDGDHAGPDLLAGLAGARQWLREHGYAGDGLYPHRFWTPTACPGDQLAGWVADDGPTPAPTPPQPPVPPAESEHPMQTVVLPDGTVLVTVVGTDSAVWTNERPPGGVWAGWISIGGEVRHPL